MHFPSFTANGCPSSNLLHSSDSLSLSNCSSDTLVFCRRIPGSNFAAFRMIHSILKFIFMIFIMLLTIRRNSWENVITFLMKKLLKNVTNNKEDYISVSFIKNNINILCTLKGIKLFLLIFILILLIIFLFNILDQQI